MTESEAIKELERHIQFLRENWKPHPDYNVIEALGTAIKALEKHISVSREIRHGDYFCPKCGSNVEYQGYCHACGQKVY